MPAMTNQTLFLLATVPFGFYCLFFTTHAIKMVALFAQFYTEFQFNDANSKQWMARPLFIRLIGIINLGMAAVVYFGWLGGD